jgi:aldehyde:ferredoxin oxidoreductase
MKGYTGKILFVDLSSGEIQEQAIPDEVYEKYLSGIGLAAYLLYKWIPPFADPLGENNIFGLVAGLLTGTGTLFAGRWLAVAKSPLTGGWGDANCGGDFGPAIKQCGYDGIFFRGIASRPVYLYSDGEVAELRDAAHLWGKDACEAEMILQAEKVRHRTVRVVTIGQGGEKLSLISGICNAQGRIAARSGLGAVMGVKKLKAVVLAGAKPIPCADRPAIMRLNKEVKGLIPSEGTHLPSWLLALIGRWMGSRKTLMRLDGLLSFGVMRTWGTSAGNQVAVSTGDAPVKNWAGSRCEYNSRKINPDLFRAREVKKYHCYACPLGCGSLCTLNQTPHKKTHKPEYETVASFGPLLLNEDLESIFYITDLLNRAGLDSISIGTVVAFAIECFQNGVIKEGDTGGLQLAWGNAPAIIDLVEQIIAREGLGDILADGVRLAAARLGAEAKDYANHAGGQELPMHDPRLDPAQGVHYEVEPTPGRHTIGGSEAYEFYRLWTRVPWAPEPPATYPVERRYIPSRESGLQAAACSMLKMLIDGAGLCIFGLHMGVDRFPLFDYLNAATGWDRSPEAYMQIGKHVQTLRQNFNIAHGVEPTEVHISPRAAGRPPLEKGPLKGRSPDFERMRSYYWQAMGWDPNSGRPPDDECHHAYTAGKDTITEDASMIAVG